MNTDELRRKRIINFAYFALITGLTYLFFRYCFLSVLPFIIAYMVATAVQKPANLITGRLHINKGLVSVFFVIILFLFAGGVVSLIGVKLFDSAKSLFSYITAKLSDFPSFIDELKYQALSIAEILPEKIESIVTDRITEWSDTVRDKGAGEIASTIMGSASSGEGLSSSIFATPLTSILNTLKGIPGFFVAAGITVLASCFMASDYDRLINIIKMQFPENKQHKLSVAKRVIFTSLGKIVRSYALIICITGTEVFIGLNVLALADIYKGGHIITISLIIAVFDILPVLGTGTFMIPWAVYAFITGKISLGTGLLVIYAVIYIVRQITEPRLIGSTVGLPPIFTLVGIYIGSQLLGFAGIFLVPILMIIIKTLNDEGVIHLFRPFDYNRDKQKRSFLFKKKKVY